MINSQIQSSCEEDKRLKLNEQMEPHHEKVANWLLNTLENCSIDNDDLRQEVGNTLRGFWEYTDHQAVCAFFKSNLGILGSESDNEIRNKICLYFVLTSCYNLLK